MNYRDNFRWARIALLAFMISLMGVPGRQAMADLIKFDWSGTIAPLEANVDPWNIGAAGKPYVISAFVNQDTLDLDVDVVVARFDLIDAQLLIDGVPQQSLERGVILIEDRDFRDSLSIILFDVEFNGVRERFFTGVRLPTSTFTFVSSLESPPVFSPADTITGGGTLGDGSSYGTFPGVGTTVTVKIIPEPSTMLLALLAFGSLCNRHVPTHLGLISSRRRS